jgi:hypothetical protein
MCIGLATRLRWERMGGRKTRVRVVGKGRHVTREGESPSCEWNEWNESYSEMQDSADMTCSPCGQTNDLPRRTELAVLYSRQHRVSTATAHVWQRHSTR